MSPFLGLLLFCYICQGFCYRTVSPPTTTPSTDCNGGPRTLSGQCCSIPFTYKGVKYNFCTAAGWCSLDPVYKGNWGHCRRSLLQSEPMSTWECENVTDVPSHVRIEYPLSSFYKKYLHAYGIPVISSENASDAALRRACYVVVFLLADREDIRRSVYKSRGRAGVIAATEGVTSIPEHSWLDDFWNKRARGLGGIIWAPISTCGEENILCYKNGQDRYPNQDLFVHEVVHGLHNLGAVYSIPDFDDRLRKRFNYLNSTGKLWKNTYAMSTHWEYLAEGAQSFFDCNAESHPPNGIYNYVNTRSELKCYDPVLYGFLKEIFPCQNRFLKRCDARAGVKPYNFKMNCTSDGNGIWMDFQTKGPAKTQPTSIPLNTSPTPCTSPSPPVCKDDYLLFFPGRE